MNNKTFSSSSPWRRRTPVILIVAILSVPPAAFAADERGAAAAAAAPPAPKVADAGSDTKTHNSNNRHPHPGWVLACGAVAPMASVALYAAPWPTIAKICRDKTSGDLPLLPYTSMLSNCFVWAVYGTLKNEPKLVSSQSIGFVLALYYVARFVPHYYAAIHHHQYHRDDSGDGGEGGLGATKTAAAGTAAATVRRHLQGCGVICGSTAAMALLLPLSESTKYIGLFSVVMNIFLFGSPLVALRTVIETKSAASIPLPFTIATAFTCSMWLIYGKIAMDDIAVYLPSFVGLAFALAQIALKIAYRDQQQRPKQRSSALLSGSSESVQMHERLLQPADHTHKN